MIHTCFLSDSGVLRTMLRIVHFWAQEDRVGSRDVLSHSLLLQNFLYLSLDAKFEGYCVDC